MAEWLSKGNVAKMVGISSQAMYALCKEGGKLSAFYDPDVKRLNIDTPEVQFWIKSQIEKHKKLKRFSEQARSSESFSVENSVQDDISGEVFDNMTVREICQKWGAVEKLKEYMKTRKIITETEYKKLQLHKARGDVISKKEVADVCFNLINLCNGRMLEMPSGVLPRVRALIKSNPIDCDEQCTEIMVKQISRIIKSAKEEILSKLETTLDVKEEDE